MSDAPGPDLDADINAAWEEQEGLFARDVDGQLIRMTRATASDFEKSVTIELDGQTVKVPKAVPATDEQGHVKRDAQGRAIPRLTTIYDAACQLYRDTLKQPNPIPLLCHREYMDPVGVCRVCVVQIAQLKKRTGKVEIDRKLAPACKRMVEDTMIVHTINSPDTASAARVRQSVEVLTDLLMSDHPSPCAKERHNPGDCELEALAKRLELGSPRYRKRGFELPRDTSSFVIAVDHNACILCDRCVRGCNTIKENHVLGRMGKGYAARVAFDLDAPMGASSCVACGECMVDCPTGALTHQGIIETAAKPRGADDVDEDALINHENPEIRAAFAGVARPFLRWNAHAVWRTRYKKGEIICREGDYGSTAFLIENGSVDIFLGTPAKHLVNEPARGLLGWFGKFTNRLRANDQQDQSRAIAVDAPVTLPLAKPQARLETGDLFGEMTCMSLYPRSATVRAAEDCTVLEMLRNVLYIMQRSPSFRRIVERKYRDRAIENHLRGVGLFQSLKSDEAGFQAFVNSLRNHISLRRCEPGEVILRQGTPATDGFYLVRTGFVRVSQARPGGESVLNYVGPGGSIGEIGLLADIPELRNLAPPGVRTATCTALDHVELVRIAAADFRRIIEDHPTVRSLLVEQARERLEADHDARQRLESTPLADFLSQGLANAQSLLVLDLHKCTRCDECTKACADTHEGVTRLIREGLRYDKFLVASSCRSCLDPTCMVGCPVGSIRRGISKEIVIEDWCIGCGLCSENCPYGNINMVSLTDQPAPRAQVTRKATTCDLCTSLGPNSEPSCVYACPHDAAHRMTGRELLTLVQGAEGTGGFE